MKNKKYDLEDRLIDFGVNDRAVGKHEQEKVCRASFIRTIGSLRHITLFELW